MSGKSALLRQTGLIVLMAHMGSFVPAGEAHIPITDKIFTRVGASDNLSGGESTFMVEMNGLSGNEEARAKTLAFFVLVPRGDYFFTLKNWAAGPEPWKLSICHW